jgi:type II secretory pathway component PulJ
MLAVGIFSMVLVSIYAGWNSILRGSRAAIDAAEEAQRARIAVSALEDALVGLQMFGGNLAHYAFFADTSGDHAYLSFVTRLPAAFPGGGLFGEHHLRRVSFGVEVTNGEPQLVLRQVPLLQPVKPGEEPYPITLAPQVNVFAAEFWDPRAAEWKTEWPFTNQLPKRIRVALAFGGRRGSGTSRAPEVVFRDVLLPGVMVPREWQFAGPVAGAPGAGGGGTNLPGTPPLRPGQPVNQQPAPAPRPRPR